MPEPLNTPLSRMVAFALLSAVEGDLRELLIAELGREPDPRATLGEDRFQKAVARAAGDGGQGGSPRMEELARYLDFADYLPVLNAAEGALEPGLRSYLRRLTPAVERLATIRNRVYHARPLEPGDESEVSQRADEFAASDQAWWAGVRATAGRLRSDPGYVLNLAIPVEADTAAAAHNLPSPDFDETGLLGRARDVDRLRELCYGPYPVITVTGPGGIGKTATALKVAYDVLDRPDCPFEAVVWSTSKTSQLTAQGAVRIREAIETSLGMFSGVARQLAGAVEQGAEPEEEVLSYLGEFNILLILDNLETIIDARVRGFLERLPRKSKVLITSRVGLGAFEFPYPLAPLGPNESVTLLRRLAGARNLRGLLACPNEQVEGYCRRMSFNPGWMKWFVAAVQAGRAPEDVLAHPQIFLDYCMENVYASLSADARAVLTALHALGRKASTAELSYVSGLEAARTQVALQQLLSGSFAVMDNQPTGATFETTYAVAELALAFLQRSKMADPATAAAAHGRIRELVATKEETEAWAGSRAPLVIQRILLRSHHDVIVARQLVSALRASRSGRWEDANRALEEARMLAPDFHEVHRVEAYVRGEEGNFPAALAAYEAAVELAPADAATRYWFGGFLLRSMRDSAAAAQQFRRGLAADPESADLHVELARALLYQKAFPEAESELMWCFRRLASLPTFTRVKAETLVLSLYARRADHSLEELRDAGAAATDLGKLSAFYDTIAAGERDGHMRREVDKARLTAERLAHRPDGAREEATRFLAWLAGTEARHGGSVPAAPIFGERGRVTGVRGGYGFIEPDGGGSIFFHSSAVTGCTIASLAAGQRVTFDRGVSPDGRPCADRVAPEAAAPRTVDT